MYLRLGGFFESEAGTTVIGKLDAGIKSE